MLHFLHTFAPQPILAVVGPFTLHWYGLMYLVAIAIAYLLVDRLLRRLKISGATNLLERLPTFTVGLFISSIIGARLYHVVSQWSIYYATHLDKLFALNEGGLAIHGGLIGGGLFLWWYGKKLFATKKTSSLFWLADVLTPAVLLGQAIGRWGNYFNQELFGRPTNLPWGIPIAPEYRQAAFADATYFHPAFLYESLWDLAGFFFLAWWQRRVLKQGRLGAGLVTFPYLIWMGVGRVLVELIRIEPAPIIFGLRWHLIISLCIVLIGLLGFMTTLLQKRRVY
ncbi:prolipoprotein diacylglyceryl transferase [Candidatus Uhrbacteria bacterium CG10_big_fil_rev_8_21_14_0_10_48_11]|uniref:Phosphatidylglycerol--prolipoprotein diacylglyceryl transferase n=1 Tax=Candidatus Uhrbacteria bacterium CG10_big_fil_rev_8_21_14_0_10_48_11 TaxID=1975037 RepID=A0A2M8LF41_9BACT|nr:MAG: prolipoprotein diacylglyceryl transferase [Candidatus Uhrbacteria bacterium CG10_big_fil_rev_8_21_14_0_10_48_11]